ncbi:MAG TPA: acetyl-CoA hydrolase/transferase C-terminal domain-containing protein [Dongiaceae bacterium]|nr:acetyl-CoA hydrolase/transferase C-terminal domain-containing protein [Dongiaceae bacterium]
MAFQGQQGEARKASAAEAAGLVKSGMWLDWGFGLCQPDKFDAALAARKDELQGVKIRVCLSMRQRQVLECDPDGTHFQWFNWHFSGYDRKHHDAGRCNYIPMNFGEVPDWYRRFIDPCDILVLKTAPMDENGFFNFGMSSTYSYATAERARCIIVEVSEHAPVVFGEQSAIHVSHVDYIIDEGSDPLPELKNPPVSEIDRKIAALIAAEVEDGACLQIGIGGMPNAVCSMLQEAGVKDLGIHTEMLGDGLVDLIEAGLITNARKRVNPGKTVFTFAGGSRKLYDIIHRNQDIHVYPVDYTNLPHNIMQNDKVVSINNTTQIDLQGQAASESAGTRHISGTGGQLQFVRGAYASHGGKSFICMSSTYDKKGEPQSRIVSMLTPGNIVTTPRVDTMYVATEYGIVNLKGKSVSERAKALISIAHPKFREQLERDARDKNIICKGFV